MKPLATNHDQQPERNFAEDGSYTPSAFIGLLAPIQEYQSENSIREAFFETTGLLPQLVCKSADFFVVMSHSSRTEVAHDPVLGVTVFLHGEVYPDSNYGRGAGGSFVLNTYKEQGIIRAASNINGSYAALLITPKEVSIVIDRVGSRKVFFSQDARGFWISTTLALHPRRKIDAAGVASLIINRFQYCGRTLYKGVRTLERAHIHTFSRRGVINRCYWSYGFSDVDEEAFVAALSDRKADLVALVKRAVHRRMPVHGKVLLSLSGGMDSRGILGALLSEASPSVSLGAVSYGTHQDDDVVVAHELCRLAGLEQRMVSFRGDITEAIKLNGQHCDGLVFSIPKVLMGLSRLSPHLERKVSFLSETNALAGIT